jgi:hypothetical protein
MGRFVRYRSVAITVTVNPRVKCRYGYNISERMGMLQCVVGVPIQATMYFLTDFRPNFLVELLTHLFDIR